MSRRVKVIIGAVVVVGLVSGLVVWNVQRNAKDSPQWLFSETAQSATLVPLSQGKYTLTLNDAQSRVLAFTDRPNRLALPMKAQILVGLWSKFFQTDAPNAVLVEHSPNGAANSLALTLSNPRISKTANSGNAQLSFDATVLKDEELSKLAQPSRTFHVDAPAKFDEVSLFIDAGFEESFTLQCDTDNSSQSYTFSLPSQFAQEEQTETACTGPPTNGSLSYPDSRALGTGW